MQLVSDPTDILARFIFERGGAAREEQIRLTRGIARGFEEGRHVVAEAPTGVGKSLGGLAAAAAVPEGQQVLVSTRTKALQDQYRSHDLPIYQSVTGRTVAVLKGRANYLCRQSINENAGRIEPDDFRVVEAAGNALDAGASEWSEIGISKDQAWLVSTTADDCAGVDCEFFDQCPAMEANEQARDADLVVVNHTLLALAMTFRARAIAEAPIVIIDEAHHLADVTRDTVGGRITTPGMRAFARRISNEGGPHVDVREDLLMRIDDGFLEGEELELTKKLVLEAADDLRAAYKSVPGPSKRLQQRSGSFFAIVRQLHNVVEAEVPMPLYAEKHRSAITVRPTDVASVIAGWASTKHSTIHMSATLAAGRGPKARTRFTPYLEETGLDPERVLASVLPSPFLEDAAIAYAPSDGIPPPKGRGDVNAHMREQWVRGEVQRLLELTDGRALLLATSYRMANVLFDAASEAGYRTWKQAQGESVSSLIGHFRDDEHSVLVGVDTLREGIDVPGPACSLVVYDKIPHLRPDDPFVRAWCGPEGPRAKSRYHRLDRPRAQLALTQAMGRLVRSHGDRGIVACLDQRIWNDDNRSFRAALRWPVTDSFERVAAFWRRVHGEAT